MRTFGIALVLLVLVLTGCMGVILNGSTEEITVNVDPIGSNIEMDHVFVGMSPMTIDMARGESHLLEVSMPGYETESYQISKSADSGIIIMDILFTGGIGLLIDMSAGSMYNLSPDAISASLDQSVTINDNSINITLSEL